MQYLYFIIFLSVVSIKATAQVKENFLGNANIVWSVETYADINLKHNSYEKSYEQAIDYPVREFHSYIKLKSIDPLEFNNSMLYHEHEPLTFLEILWNQRFDFNIYYDEFLKQEIPQEEKHNLGTKISKKYFSTPIIELDSSSAQQKHPYITQINPKKLERIRIKKIIYYDIKKCAFYAQPIAAALLYNEYEDFVFQGTKPLFWFPVSTIYGQFDINNPNIIWAKKIEYYTHYQSDTFKKDIDLKAAFTQMGECMHHERNTLKVIAGNLTTATFMTSSDILNMENVIDTIVYFDSEKFTEITAVVEYKILFEELSYFNFTQAWLWDNWQKRLYIYPVYWGAGGFRYSKNGNFLNWRMLFYRYY